MDESELLIARAALAEPTEALAAWTQWRATYSIEEASSLLSWAGGYIYRNLQAAGVNDPYLAGISRFNWVMNNRRLMGALPTIKAIADRWPITPLKSFGMSQETYSRGLRPLADFDFYTAPSNAYDVKDLLESQGFRALDDVSADEFSSRILRLRGSWNFLDPQRIDLDLHWRLLGHLDGPTSERLVAAHSRLTATEFGSVRMLSPDLMLVTLAVHHLLQPPGQLNGIFDFAHLLPETDPARVARLARQIGVSRELAGVAAHARTLAGSEARSSELERALEPGARRQRDRLTVRRSLPCFERLPERYFEPTRLTAPRLYRAWFALGRPAWLERRLIRRLGSLSRTGPNADDQFPAIGGKLGPGWHYKFPGDQFRWADLPDARIVFPAPANATGLKLSLDPEMWPAAPIGSFDVFVGGRRIGRCDKTRSDFTFALPESRGDVEVSFRQHGFSRYSRPGMSAEWFRMLAPIKSVELVA